MAWVSQMNTTDPPFGDPGQELAGDEEFSRHWANELALTRSPREAATLASTTQAALRAWQRFSDGAAVLVTAARRRTTESITRVESVVREMAPSVGRGLLAVSQVAAVTYAEHLNYQYRHADSILRERDWWALSSWSDEELGRFGVMAETFNRRDFGKAMCRSYRSYGGRQLRRLLATWSDEPSLHLRRPIIRDALADHMAGRYRVSVPTLLPCVEGAVADGFGLGTRGPVTAGLEPLVEIFDGLEALELDIAIGSLSQLYGRINFGATSTLSPRLNRHLILHGRSVRYGTEANSLKVFLHLDEIHTQLAAKHRLEDGRAVSLEQRPIRVANDLVKLLGVPDEIIRASRAMLPLLETRMATTQSR